MASTKIINVLKDDKFDEILDLFREATAKEIIFILPKKSKAFAKEEHFETLRRESEENGKAISLLCHDSQINQWAQKYNFDVLSPSGKTGKPSAILAVNQFGDNKSITDEDPENPEIPDDNEEDMEDLGFHDEDGDDLTDEDLPINKKRKDDDDDDDSQTDDDSDEDDEEEDDDKDDDEEEDDEELKRVDEELSSEFREENLADDVAFDENQDYKVIPASIARKNLDDILTQSDEDVRNIKIRGDIKSTSLGIKKGAKAKTDELTEVWNSNSVWDKIQPARRGSSWFNFIRKTSAQKVKRYNPKRKKIIKILGFSLLAVLVVFGVLVYAISGSAKIKIVPAKENLNARIKATASDKYSLVDSNFNKIPGQLFNVEKSVTKSFDSTGEKDVAQKARGKITVYNDMTTAQPLIATTRFQTKEGLVFRTLKNITVPAAKSSSGTIEVEVVADKAGAEYNIAPTDFIISAFKEKNDTVRFQKVYGRSTVAMKGGTSGKAKVVSEQDYNNAKDKVTEELKRQIGEALRTQSADLKLINTANVTIKSTTSSAQIDEATDKFDMTVVGSIKTIGFKEEHINELIQKYVEKAGTSTTQAEKADKSYIDIKFNDAENSLEFTTIVRGVQYKKINSEKILAELYGKKSPAVKAYLESLKESKVIDSARVSLSPFWVKTVPKDKAKVSMEIAFE